MPFRETVTRRSLPHWFVPNAAHFVTYRLYASIPQSILEQLRERKETFLKSRRQKEFTDLQHRERVHKQLFALYDRFLDQERIADLVDPRVAEIVRSNLYHHNGSKYHLIAYCVMPTHVHVILQPIEVAGIISAEPCVAALMVGEQRDEHSPLARIMHSLKSYTAHEANSILNRAGTFWQAESYDHWVRDEDELERIVHYIRGNPVKAGLVQRPERWRWSSCYDRFEIDGRTDGWLKGVQM